MTMFSSRTAESFDPEPNPILVEYRLDQTDKGRDIPKGTVTDCSGFYLFTEKEED